ncbi:MAG: hypothetical protein GXO87_02380 [Chlorobi bacterium]|nr:hypothetical protein [Chlorobiota bacterium]
MKFIKLFLIMIFFSAVSAASNHGIYLKTNKGISDDISKVATDIKAKLQGTDYKILFSGPVTSPDHIRQDEEDFCGFKAELFVLSNEKYNSMLTSFGSKYLVAGFLRIGIYEDPSGVNVVITDPETINRIVFNDLYENDKEDVYNQVIEKTKPFKDELISLLHAAAGGEKVSTPMEPIRDDEDLAESSKDMFMMVGEMTFFNDEDQFPEIYEKKNKEGFDGIKKLRDQFLSNIKYFEPVEDDMEYRWYPEKSDLLWKVISQIESPKKDAILLGLTRPRTEAESFNIAGSSREDDSNKCPGIDHVTAYPIEVLLIQEGDEIKVYTQREMFRMDMYFWDAGMSAFMDHMSMPGILDESIKKALLGKEYEED